MLHAFVCVVGGQGHRKMMALQDAAAKLPPCFIIFAYPLNSAVVLWVKAAIQVALSAMFIFLASFIETEWDFPSFSFVEFL